MENEGLVWNFVEEWRGGAATQLSQAQGSLSVYSDRII